MRQLAWILILAAALPAAADTWKSTTDSRLTFVASVDGGELPGTFKEFDVELTTTPDAGVVEFVVSINLAAADLGDPDTNATLFSPAWFDTGNFSQAIFKTSDIVKSSTDVVEAIGELDLKGSKKTLRFPIEFESDGDSASISGSASINRGDFKVGTGEWSSDETVGVTVELSFDVKLNRER